MFLASSNWDMQVGCCVKHGVPEVPCPQCLAEKDEGVQVCFEEMDHVFLEGEVMMAKMSNETPPTYKDLLPADHADWLVERIS